MTEPLHHRWQDLPEDCPMPLLSRRRVVGSQAMLSHILLQEGCRVPAHHHENEQFACVLSGRLRFGLGTREAGDYREVDVKEGEVLHLPANVVHSAYALEDSVALDVFSPPSEKTGIDEA